MANNDKLEENISVPSTTKCVHICECPKTAPQTKPTNTKIQELCEQFILSEETLKHISNLFLEEVKKGLARKTHDAATVKCYVTYVQDLPKGDETGKYLAIDFASRNLRLLLCNITEEGVDIKIKPYMIPEYTLFSTGAQLFDHIVDQLAKFMKAEQLTREKIFLALTFGFPLVQKGLEKGFLAKWTKGFKCTNVVGNDVVQLLRDAIERKGDIDVEVCAILNDATGALISCSYDHSTCKIVAIIGRGTNACYQEKQKNAELFDEEDKGSGTVLINTEWGAFGDDGELNFVRTYFDREIDESSLTPGKQIFEKMVSSLYMGEIVRLVMVQLTREGLLFNGTGSTKLYTTESFPTSYIYSIESDPPDKYDNCREILKNFGLHSVTDDDCINVRFVCECVSRRSALLVAAALTALVHKINQSFITIGIDGPVYPKHPHYHNVLITTIRSLVKRGIKCMVVPARDGSGRGAALLAAAVSRRYIPNV